MQKVAGPLAVIVVCLAVLATILIPGSFTPDGTEHPSNDYSAYPSRVAPLPAKPPKHVRLEPERVTFLRMQPTDLSEPVAWDPCSPIHYVINPANAPTNGIPVIQSALAYASSVTGYLFVYDGLTDEQHTPGQDRRYQPDRYGDRWSPVLIEWLPLIGTEGAPGVGVAAPSPATFDDGRDRYVTGVIRLSQDVFARYQGNADASITKQGRTRNLNMQRSAVLHETLHVLGLGHSTTMTDIMFPAITTYTDDLSAQDTIGLRILGRQPCRTS